MKDLSSCEGILRNRPDVAFYVDSNHLFELKNITPDMRAHVKHWAVRLCTGSLSDIIADALHVFDFALKYDIPPHLLTLFFESSFPMLLAQVTEQLAAKKFHSLVVQVPTLPSSDIVFQVFERCRGLRHEFRVDMAVQGSDPVIVDQP